MAQAEHLPIYKASYDLCLYLEQVVRGFSRYHKYAIGADLRDRAMTSPRYARSAFQFHPVLITPESRSVRSRKCSYLAPERCAGPRRVSVG